MFGMAFGIVMKSNVVTMIRCEPHQKIGKPAEKAYDSTYYVSTPAFYFFHFPPSLLPNRKATSICEIAQF